MAKGNALFCAEKKKRGRDEKKKKRGMATNPSSVATPRHGALDGGADDAAGGNDDRDAALVEQWRQTIMERLDAGLRDFGIDDVLSKDDREALCAQKRGLRRLCEMACDYRNLVLDTVGADDHVGLDARVAQNVFDIRPVHLADSSTVLVDSCDDAAFRRRFGLSDGGDELVFCGTRDTERVSAPSVGSSQGDKGLARQRRMRDALMRFHIDKYRTPDWIMFIEFRLARGDTTIDLYALNAEEASLESLRERYPDYANKWKPDLYGVDGTDRVLSPRRIDALRVTLDQVLARRGWMVYRQEGLPFQYKVGPAPSAEPPREPNSAGGFWSGFQSAVRRLFFH